MVEEGNFRPRIKPPHVALNSNVPDGWDGGNRVLEVMLTYEPIEEGSSTMVFKFVVTPVNFPGYCAPEGEMNLPIIADCKIRFNLDSAIKWRWSRDYWVISAKREYRDFYGDVRKIDDDFFEFKAKFNEGGDPHTVHHFNLNIDYWQGPGRWLPITIDPDVGNPRPPGMIPFDGPIKIIPSGTVSEA